MKRGLSAKHLITALCPIFATTFTVSCCMIEKKGFFRNGCMVKISAKIYVSVFSPFAVFLFVLSQGLFSSLMFFSAILIHELSHILCLFCLGATIKKVSVYPFGIDINADTQRLNYKKELVVSLSGSTANLLFALFGGVVFNHITHPKLLFFILCHLSLGLFNLLPITLFDGGKALRLILYDRLEIDTAFRAAFLCDLVFSVMLLCLCTYLIRLSGFNLSVIMIAIYACAAIFYLNITKRSRHTSTPDCLFY